MKAMVFVQMDPKDETGATWTAGFTEGKVGLMFYPATLLSSTKFDVGVAGIHRVLSKREILDAARVVVVVAGMDGALPSVVGGLVDRPVIAVPTSVGYGAGFQGLAPLLTMLNSCASGIAVMNIDNGFGAGVLAHRINILGER